MKKTVIEVIKEYHLEMADKIYKDVYGKEHNLVNLKELAHLEVKDFYYNLKTNEAVITTLDIEKIK